MAAEESTRITSNSDAYTAFLRTAANNYKYRFLDQLLIHAQKPEATACAEISMWNRLGRWVNRGSTGIALLTDQNATYRLRYVFDVSDTNSRIGREVTLWQMEDRIRKDIWYVENWTMHLDYKIILMTVWQVLFKNKNVY